MAAVQVGEGTMPKIFLATVAFVVAVGFAAYYSARGPEFTSEVTVAWCGFEEAGAISTPSYCDLGYTCYNATQQLEQADHETEVRAGRSFFCFAAGSPQSTALRACPGDDRVCPGQVA